MNSVKHLVPFKNKKIAKRGNSFFYPQVIFFIGLISFNQFPQSIPIFKGTTIITVVRNDTIWIGADSKLTNKNGEFVKDTCKIVFYKDVVFAHAGLFTDNSTNINIQNVFMDAYRDSTAIQRIADHFTIELAGKVAKVNQELITRYKLKIWDDVSDYSIETIVAGFRKGRGEVWINNCVPKIITDKDNRAGSLDCSYSFIFTDTTKFQVHFSGCDYYIRNLRDIFKTGEVVPLIKALILIECAFEPKYVGEPISIIRITKDGIEWEENQNCK